MKLGFFFNAIMVACLLGLAGLASAAEDWKYTESGEVDQGPVDGPPGVMVLIPGGEFTMGDNEGSRNERPEHTVWLDAYLIDRYEVTMAEYQKFLDHDYSIEPPPLWDDERCQTILRMGRQTLTHRSRMGKSRTWNGWSAISLGAYATICRYCQL
jgi:formylglycine-generating enzyme required for sulfatase activity